MKVDFSLTLKRMDGEPIPKSNTDKSPTILQDVAVEALLSFDPQKNIKGKDKMMRWQIAEKIYKADGKDVKLEAEEVAKIKELIGEIYGPLIVGQAWNMLEGDAVEEDVEDKDSEAPATK